MFRIYVISDERNSLHMGGCVSKIVLSHSIFTRLDIMVSDEVMTEGQSSVIFNQVKTPKNSDGVPDL